MIKQCLVILTMKTKPQTARPAGIFHSQSETITETGGLASNLSYSQLINMWDHMCVNLPKPDLRNVHSGLILRLLWTETTQFLGRRAAFQLV